MRPAKYVTNDLRKDIVKVAEHQAEYQTLPSVFLANGNVCVSRWECEEGFEKEMIQQKKQIFLYEKKFNESRTPFLLSPTFHSDKFLMSIEPFDGTVVRRTANRSLFGGLPQVSYDNPSHRCYLWEVSSSELQQIENNDWSFWVYQFNFRKPITPYLLSVYEDQPII
jgi:hypothetical protein